LRLIKDGHLPLEHGKETNRFPTISNEQASLFVLESPGEENNKI